MSAERNIDDQEYENALYLALKWRIEMLRDAADQWLKNMPTISCTQDRVRIGDNLKAIDVLQEELASIVKKNNKSKRQS